MPDGLRSASPEIGETALSAMRKLPWRKRRGLQPKPQGGKTGVIRTVIVVNTIVEVEPPDAACGMPHTHTHTHTHNIQQRG